MLSGNIEGILYIIIFGFIFFFFLIGIFLICNYVAKINNSTSNNNSLEENLINNV